MRSSVWVLRTLVGHTFSALPSPRSQWRFPLSLYILYHGGSPLSTLFSKNFGYFLSPSWEGEVATLGRYVVRLAVLGYLTTAFCSLGSVLSRPFFVLTLGDGVAYHLKQYLSVNCKPFSFTL